MLEVCVLICSTRPNRVGDQVGRWAHGVLSKREDANFTLVDLRDMGLPLFDEPHPPAATGTPVHEHTRRWSQVVSGFDAFVFVVPEYNHSIPGAFKNALDYLYAEWADKAAGFVGYGTVGAARSIEHLRGVMGQLNIADVRPQVSLFLDRDFDAGRFVPTDRHARALGRVADKTVEWGSALKTVRESRSAVV